jgi:hypothetical protein
VAWGTSSQISSNRFFRQDQGSAATYTRVVKVWMFDTRRTLAEKRLVPVYEATAKSIGSANLNAVMPYILEAVFTDWPGRSGETKAVWTSVKG